MHSTKSLKQKIQAGEFDTVFSRLYPQTDLDDSRRRYIEALSSFEGLFGEREVKLVSAPGRTELGGNHTDHQNGNVLAAAVDLDIICVVSPNGENAIRIQSEGFPLDQVSLDDLAVREREGETSAALIRGMAYGAVQIGCSPKGFDAYMTSNVLKGSGLSSSAAYEVAIGNMLKAVSGGQMDPVQIAQLGQYAEQFYFGKPSGLMDQMACSLGGIIQINFETPETPKVRPIQFDLDASGYSLCIVDTKGSHADLTGDYASIPEEMALVSKFYGKSVLSQVDERQFMEDIALIRAKTGDRAVLRAMHFFSDNALAPKMADALARGDFSEFLVLSIQSGRSSLQCLQNVYSSTSPQEQGLTLALALSERLLSGLGAWRVHGGGFAGTIQAFVPNTLLDEYRAAQDKVFGPGACHVLSVRPVGGIEVIPIKEA